MGRRKKPEPDNEEQSARFLEAARQLEGDMDKEAFKQLLGKMLKAPKRKKE